MKTLLVVVATALVVTLTGASVLSAQNVAALRAPEPVWESCEEMHDTYVGRFERLEGFGLSRMVLPPMRDFGMQLDLGRTRYTLESLELVGLLKRDPPVVYMTSRHPDTTAVSPVTFKTRKLTEFEKTSVAALRDGQDIVTAGGDTSPTVQAVGALRAKETCRKCHYSAKLGDLLGAFTYSLRSK
jgi:hypothetical protein